MGVQEKCEFVEAQIIFKLARKKFLVIEIQSETLQIYY